MKAKGSKVQILISNMIIFPKELYLGTTFPFSKAEIIFFFHSVILQGRYGYLSLIKFQISLVLREVMDLEAKCVIILLMFDFVWQSTSSMDNSQKL